MMGSLQVPANCPSAAMLESSCGYLLQELKLIWNEVGNDQHERDKVLAELEQECMEVYKRKVDSANVSRMRLHQALADSEAEFTNLLISLGEPSYPNRPEKLTGSIKEQLEIITPALREMQQRKEERMNQFRKVQIQIHRISSEIAGHPETESDSVLVNEADLSLKKLEEYQNELQRLHKEKGDRLRKVGDYMKEVQELATTMGMDSSKIITEVHPSLPALNIQQPKNISNTILEKFKITVENLKTEKQQRLEKVREASAHASIVTECLKGNNTSNSFKYETDFLIAASKMKQISSLQLHRLGKALKNLWNLMDTSYEDRQSFTNITTFSSLVSESYIPGRGNLTLERLNEVESEVQRLDQLKASKMKELFLKKKMELEEICKQSHMEMPLQSKMENIMDLITSGKMEHSDLLMSMEEQVSKAEKEAHSRKDIMDKVEKWISACDEECWLTEYSRDENRYSVRRGAHKDLRHAERARIIVNKIPALVEMLMRKTRSWEAERKKIFLYDEIPLLGMLEEYKLSRQEKEVEQHRQRERKKLQGQVAAEQENIFGSRPNTSNRRITNRSLNDNFGSVIPSNKKLSSAIEQLVPRTVAMQGTNFNKEIKKAQAKKLLRYYNNAPIRVDTASEISATFSDLSTP